MTDTSVAYTSASDSAAAGEDLARQLREGLKGKSPDAVILFASPRYDHAPLLEALQQGCRPGVLVGCSSAGEFVSGERGEGAASALALLSDSMRFSAGLGRNLRDPNRTAAREVISAFRGNSTTGFAHRSALLLTDALAGGTEELIEELTTLTGGTYKFFGGGAGDDARFSQTQVFMGNEIASDAVVALEILSKKPIGVGVAHGWVPASDPMRVTQAEGNRLIGINSIPAADLFQEYAEASGQEFKREDPVPFFLHNVIGIKSDNGCRLRVPLSIEPDGTVVCASDVPEGATIHIMKSGDKSAAEAAAQAVREAVAQTSPARPRAALFFDCVATRLRLGRAFDTELDTITSILGPDVSYVGCNTYGQIARADNQFSGFHNCTAVVCTFPE